MRPLIIVTVFNRAGETARALAALAETTGPGDAEFTIVDNGSTDGAGEAIDLWLSEHKAIAATIYHLPENTGIPRALNLAVERHRAPGQPVVKWDNDVVSLTPGWVGKVAAFVEARRRAGPVALVRAWREGTQVESAWREDWGGFPFYVPQRKLGYAVWYAGEFMDRVRHFDVLSPGHKYGFEDILICHKAARLGWAELMWEGWQVEDIQRSSALRGKREHVAEMRPLFQERVKALARGGPVETGPDGWPREPGR